MKLLLPTNVPLDPELPDEVTAVLYDPAQPVPEEHLDAEALVAWSNNKRALADSAARMRRLRWIQALSAGTDHLLNLELPEGAVITSGVGLHDKTVAEHALTLTLALVRRLPASARAQSERRWDHNLGGVQPLHPPGPVTTLLDARVLVWGFGSIGQTLAPMLAGLGAEVRGVARSAGERSGFPVIADTELDQALPETDVLVMILPSTPETAKALNARRLALLQDAYVVNVGRGTTADENAVAAALQDGSLPGMATDVTAVEPLPAESALWDAPNLILTPHAAGGRPVGADAVIAENLRALLAGEEMRNVVA